MCSVLVDLLLIWQLWMNVPTYILASYIIKFHFFIKKSEEYKSYFILYHGSFQNLWSISYLMNHMNKLYDPYNIDHITLNDYILWIKYVCIPSWNGKPRATNILVKFWIRNEDSFVDTIFCICCVHWFQGLTTLIL